MVRYPEVGETRVVFAYRYSRVGDGRKRLGRFDGVDPPVDSSNAESGATAKPRVLVTGNTIPGNALAATLVRRGIDPTFVDAGYRSSAGGRRVLLWPPALTVLDDLGVGEQVRSDADPLQRLRVDYGDRNLRVAAAPDASPPLAVDRATLRDSLASLVPDSVCHDRAVGGLDDRGDQVRVTFENGHRNGFDAVVGADGPTSSLRRMTAEDTSGAELHEWSFVINGPDAEPRTINEFWSEDGFATVTPVDEGLAVRVVVRSNVLTEPHRETAPRTAASAIAKDLIDLFEDRDLDSTQYHRISTSPHGTKFRKRRFALCGTAARPIGIPTGLDPGLGLVDAQALATSLSEAEGVLDGLETYESRCSRRLARIRRSARELTLADGYPPVDPDGPLQYVGGYRGVVLATVLDNGLSGLALTSSV